MTAPIDFAALPHNVRTVALVGHYLQCWALLEGVLERTIGKVVGLSALQAAIVVKNMQLRDKISLLKTVINLSPYPKQQEYIDTLTSVADITRTERNIIAHESFHQDDKGDGVRFMIVRAKGKITFPDIRWSVNDFGNKTQRIFELVAEIEEIRQTINPLSGPTANVMLGGLGLLGSPNHLLPHILDSGLLEATVEIDDGSQPCSDE
jgi:hypothetical protein